MPPTGVIKSESHFAYILIAEDELRTWCYLHQKPFFIALHFAARKPMAQGSSIYEHF